MGEEETHPAAVPCHSPEQRQTGRSPIPSLEHKGGIHMDLNRVTEKVQEALASAQRKAASGGQQNIDVIHLLVSLLEQEPGLAVSVLRKADVDVSGLKQRAEQELGRLPKVTGASGGSEQVYLSGGLNRLLARAEDEAKRFKDEYISVEHLLLAMTEDGGLVGRL